MKYVVAVSGGVDSAVLLDRLKKVTEHELIVAHFDHGIRDDSAADARFVAGLAEQYGLEFETKREELGASASEEYARERRYVFLREIAKKHNAKIMTAHHRDDVIETIAINLVRGTGWRGLAVLNDPEIERPLLAEPKQELYDYALKNGLEWVEDKTNASNKYLRNQLRRRLHSLDPTVKNKLYNKRNEQRELAARIDIEAAKLTGNSRYFMTMIDKTSAIEILRAQLAQQKRSLTRPQRERMLHAIKTAHPGSQHQAGDGIETRFTVRNFIVKTPL